MNIPVNIISILGMLNFHSNKEEWGFKFHNVVKMLSLFILNPVPLVAASHKPKPVPIKQGLFYDN